MDPFSDHQDRAPNDRQCKPDHPPRTHQVDGIRANNSNLGGLEASNSTRPEAELQKRGTNSLTITITGAMCMYSDIYLYAGGGGGTGGGVRFGASALGLPSESDEQKAKHFDEGRSRVRSWDEVLRWVGDKEVKAAMEGRKALMEFCRQRPPSHLRSYRGRTRRERPCLVATKSCWP